MSFPLIGPDQDFAIWAVLIGIAAFGFWCERFPWGRKYSGVMLLITLAIVLANLRIIPTSAPAYGVVWDYLVPIAIPLLLLQADLKRIVREAGPTLIAFVIGAASVVAGVIVGLVVLVGALQHLPVVEALPAFGGDEGVAAMPVEVPLADVRRAVPGRLEDLAHAHHAT